MIICGMESGGVADVISCDMFRVNVSRMCVNCTACCLEANSSTDTGVDVSYVSAGGFFLVRFQSSLRVKEF